MHSDHRQPGCTLNRATVADPRCTTPTTVLSGVRVSSGLSMLLRSMLAIPPSSVVWEGTYDPRAATSAQYPDRLSKCSGNRSLHSLREALAEVGGAVGVAGWTAVEEGADALGAVGQLAHHRGEPGIGGTARVGAVPQAVGQARLHRRDDRRRNGRDRTRDLHRPIDGVVVDLRHEPAA